MPPTNTTALLAPLLAIALTTLPACGQDSAPNAQPDTPPDFKQVSRPGSVDLDTAYALDNLSIPRDQIHTLLPKDAIPAITDPTLDSIADSDWLKPTDRVIVITIEDTTVAVPINILNYHEIVNLTIAGQPIAATYCPLCDSATVVSRRITRTAGDGTTTQETIELGVSGALYNSNVLMYDRTDLALWSQLGMMAVSGPLVGTSLEHLPLRITSWETFTTDHPDATVVSRETGHERDYTSSPYGGFFSSDRLLVPVAGLGDKLPLKTLGLGVFARGQATFIPADTLGDDFTLDTPLGPVRARHSDAGIEVLEAPKGVLTAQTFYYSWSAFHPNTKVISTDTSVIPDN